MVAAHNDSKVTGRLFRREPSDVQCRLYRWFWMVAYLGLFALKDSLPDRFSRDATTLAEMIEKGNVVEGSYGAMASIYSHVPGPLLPFLPAAICLPSIWIIMGYVRSYPVMMLMPILMMPYLIMNFMNPTKETMVALMALAVYGISQSKLTTFRAVIVVLVMYGAYAAFIRSYYALIAVIFIGLLVLHHVPRAVGVIAVLLGLAAMLALPPDFYIALQGPRDEAAFFKFQHRDRRFAAHASRPPDQIFVEDGVAEDDDALPGEFRYECLHVFRVCLQIHLLPNPSPRLACGKLSLAHASGARDRTTTFEC